MVSTRTLFPILFLLEDSISLLHLHHSLDRLKRQLAAVLIADPAHVDNSDHNDNTLDGTPPDWLIAAADDVGIPYSIPKSPDSDESLDSSSH